MLDEVALAKLAEIPAVGSEERLFWLEAAEQHGFYKRWPGTIYVASRDDVLTLMSEARKQGQRDCLGASFGPGSSPSGDAPDGSSSQATAIPSRGPTDIAALNAAATSGEWTAEGAGRITAAGTSPGYDIPVWGTVLTAHDTKDVEDGVTHWAADGTRQANARFVAALVNAWRSGKLMVKP